MEDQTTARLDADASESPGRHSRRRFMLAGLAGAAAGTFVASRERAAATSGGGDQGPLLMGSNSLFRAPSTFSNLPNVSSVATDIVASPNFGLYTTVAGYYVFRADARPAGSSYASGIEAYGTGGAIGVYGDSPAGVGLFGSGRTGVSGAGTDGDGLAGSSTNAYGGSFSGGRAAIRLGPKSGAGAPTTGVHSRGELVVDNAGVLWLCKTSGTPGTWVQVSEQPVPAATPAPAAPAVPSLKILPTPDRFVDTRSGLGGVQGPVVAGTTSTFQITGRNGESGNPALQVPGSATAIVGNLTVLGGPAAPVGSFLTLWPSGDRPTTASINFGPGSVVGNGVIVGLAAGKINAFVQNTCDYIIDVMGYFG